MAVNKELGRLLAGHELCSRAECRTGVNTAMGHGCVIMVYVIVGFSSFAVAGLWFL